MPDWSRRDLLLALGGVGALGGGWYVAERPHCRPRIEPLWTYRGEHWGPVVQSDGYTLVSEGYTVTGGRSRFRLAALDPNYGQAYWANVETGGGYGVPTVREGRVYVGTGSDTVRALDAETGERVWTYDAGGAEEYGGGSWTAPAVADGRVYAGVSHAEEANADPTEPRTYVHRVVALDADDGTETWAADLSRQVWTGPKLAGGAVVVGTEDGVLRGFDPDTGAERWRTELPGELREQCGVSGDVLAVVTGFGTLSGVDADDGAVLWSSPTVDAPTAFRVGGGTAVVGGESGRVVALGVGDGSVRWEYDAGVAVGAVAVGEAGRFVVDHSGHLHRVTDAGRRGSRVRLVENEYDDRCGWVPDRAFVRDAVLDRRWLTVSTDWWVRRFTVGDV